MSKKDVIDYAEEAHQQLMSDRKTIIEFYEKFRDQVNTPQDLAVNGISLTKCLELMTKQTAQLIEFTKLQSKNKPSDDDLSTQDTEELYEEIQAANKNEPREH